MESIADTVVGHVDIILINSKIDASQLTVTYEEGCGLGQHFRIPYFKISAKTSESVIVIFDTLAAKVLSSLAKSSTRILTQSESLCF
jgi:hypothetical protein